jgi:3-oxoacyl-(acyl-carrier-protein) synthase
MGIVVRKNAKVDDIMSDVDTTLTRARARGGVWQTHAEARIAPVHALGQGVASQLDEAERELAPLLALREAADDTADGGIGLIMDEIWNRIGRPASDPTLSVVFPGGIAHYTRGDTDEQPHRMDLLAGLLKARIISKLSEEECEAYATRVLELAAPLRQAVNAAAAPRVRVALLQREKTALARAAQMELAHLKRLYKSEGFSEADIHSVIPDRTPSSKVKGGASGAGPSGGGSAG